MLTQLAVQGEELVHVDALADQLLLERLAVAPGGGEELVQLAIGSVVRMPAIDDEAASGRAERGGAGGGKHGARPRSGGGGRPGAQETHRFEIAATAFEKGRARQVGCARVEGGAAPLCGDGDVAENTLPHIEQAAHPASFNKVQRGHCRCTFVSLQGTSPEAERATEGGEIRPGSSLAGDRFRFEPHPFGCFGKEVEMALRGGLGMMARARVPRLE
jgi:hypothetical protein